MQHTEGKAGEIDLTEKGKVEMTTFAEQLQQQLSLFGKEPNWTVPALANWLDRQIPHPDIPQTQSTLFIHKAITSLMESRDVPLDRLARLKYRLRNTLEKKIDHYRQVERRKGYQAALFGSEALKTEVDPSLCVTLNEDSYAPNWYYDGPFQFKKHAFLHIGELKPDGEEYQCAAHLDQMDEVNYWMRNISRRSDSSFWLQTSTDRFYPDFIALLKDGRILVVEYKGGFMADHPDSIEKKVVGELWEERSKGRCLFVMPVNRDWQAIEAKVG